MTFHHDEGLSLLELLIALALMAIIAAGLSQSLGLGIRVWETSQRIDEPEEALILRARLRGWIERAEPPNRLLPFDNEFTADQDGFSFLTLAPTPHMPEAAAMRVSITRSPDGLIMMLTYLDDFGEPLETDTRKLSESEPLFSYFDDAEPGWVPEWQEKSYLPALVKIEVDSDDWPEFTVSPLLR